MRLKNAGFELGGWEIMYYINGVLDFGFSSGNPGPLSWTDWAGTGFSGATGTPVVTIATSSASQVIAAAADYPAAAALLYGTLAP